MLRLRSFNSAITLRAMRFPKKKLHFHSEFWMCRSLTKCSPRNQDNHKKTNTYICLSGAWHVGPIVRCYAGATFDVAFLARRRTGGTYSVPSRCTTRILLVDQVRHYPPGLSEEPRSKRACQVYRPTGRSKRARKIKFLRNGIGEEGGNQSFAARFANGGLLGLLSPSWVSSSIDCRQTRALDRSQIMRERSGCDQCDSAVSSIRAVFPRIDSSVWATGHTCV
ncbi:hypothetical protein CLV78_12013 [Aliiruegeria haliotis]|uniref:Uncharacterized protein n=1 Tax=Aliiruegeria haliotis TaxID=1280846 RepID=A0A2T0REL7_9RHOB|nr:hypothetical protein CLV78_12013 [Aliiruegeria haliotis]